MTADELEIMKACIRAAVRDVVLSEEFLCAFTAAAMLAPVEIEVESTTSP